MPEAGPLEPAKGGTDSIQAVSAAKLPTSVLKQDSSIPSYQTRMKNVMNFKYINHTKPPIDPNYPAMAKKLGIPEYVPPAKDDIHYS